MTAAPSLHALLATVSQRDRARMAATLARLALPLLPEGSPFRAGLAAVDAWIGGAPEEPWIRGRSFDDAAQGHTGAARSAALAVNHAVLAATDREPWWAAMVATDVSLAWATQGDEPARSALRDSLHVELLACALALLAAYAAEPRSPVDAFLREPSREAALVALDWLADGGAEPRPPVRALVWLYAHGGAT